MPQNRYLSESCISRAAAALLMMPLVGFLPPDDPRVKATVERIDKELTRDGHVFRYIARNDGLPGEEGTFAFCTLWLTTCFAVSGDVEKAEERLAQVLEYVNDLGLLAEEIDPTRHEALGNVPQAFSHAGLIQAIVAIEEARKARREGVTPSAVTDIAYPGSKERAAAQAEESASPATEG